MLWRNARSMERTMTYLDVRPLRAPQAMPSVRNLTNPLLTSHFVVPYLYRHFVNKTFHVLLCLLAFFTIISLFLTFLIPFLHKPALKKTTILWCRNAFLKGFGRNTLQNFLFCINHDCLRENISAVNKTDLLKIYGKGFAVSYNPRLFRIYFIIWLFQNI